MSYLIGFIFKLHY